MPEQIKNTDVQPEQAAEPQVQPESEPQDEISKAVDETLAALSLYRNEYAPKVVKQSLYEGLLRGESILAIDTPTMITFSEFKATL